MISKLYYKLRRPLLCASAYENSIGPFWFFCYGCSASRHGCYQTPTPSSL